MPKAEWGVKRICPTTGKRFFDLNRTPIVSPYTGEIVALDGSRRKAPVPEEKPTAKITAASTSDKIGSDNDLIVDDDADEEVDIEDDLLEDDDDDSVSLDDIADVSGDDDDN